MMCLYMCFFVMWQIIYCREISTSFQDIAAAAWVVLWRCVCVCVCVCATQALLHCGSVCVCIYACLDRPFTVNFKWPHPNISRWLHVMSTPTAGSPWRRLRAKLNALAAHTAIYFLNCGTQYESDNRAWLLQGRLRVTENVRWRGLLQVSAWHDSSYIAGIPC